MNFQKIFRCVIILYFITEGLIAQGLWYGESYVDHITSMCSLNDGSFAFSGEAGWSEALLFKSSLGAEPEWWLEFGDGEGASGISIIQAIDGNLVFLYNDRSDDGPLILDRQKIVKVSLTGEVLWNVTLPTYMTHSAENYHELIELGDSSYAVGIGPHGIAKISILGELEWNIDPYQWPNVNSLTSHTDTSFAALYRHGNGHSPMIRIFNNAGDTLNSYELPWEIAHAGCVFANTPDRGFIIEHETSDYWRSSLAKIDSLGNTSWNSPVGNHDNYRWDITSIHISPVDENIYVVGWVNLPTSTTRDFFALKLDADGNELWRWTYDMGYNEKLYDIATINESEFTLVGYSERPEFPQNIVTFSMDEAGNHTLPTHIDQWSSQAENINLLLTSSPNPMNSNARIRIETSKSGAVKLNIYTINGSLVQSFRPVHHMRNEILIQWDATSLSSGVYLLNASQDKQSVTRKILLIK